MERENIESQSRPTGEWMQRRYISKNIAARIEGMSPDTFLVGAVASIGGALLLRLFGRDHDAHFVGQWAPTLLLLGLYAKGETRLIPRTAQMGERTHAEGREMH